MPKNGLRRESIQQIFQTHRSRLLVWVRCFLHNSEDVEDVVQESFAKSMSHLRQRDIENPEAYLYTAAKNLALKQNQLSVNRLSDALDELSLGDFVDVDDPVMQHTAAKEEMSWLCEAIKNLPVQCRRVFVLKKVYGFSHEEIAQRLNLSKNTVHQHLAKGVARCAVFMASHGYSRGDTQKVLKRVSKESV